MEIKSNHFEVLSYLLWKHQYLLPVLLSWVYLHLSLRLLQALVHHWGYSLRQNPVPLLQGKPRRRLLLGQRRLKPPSSQLHALLPWKLPTLRFEPLEKYNHHHQFIHSHREHSLIKRNEEGYFEGSVCWVNFPRRPPGLLHQGVKMAFVKLGPFQYL